MGSYEFIQRSTPKGIKLFPIGREELNKMLEAGTAQPNPKWPKIYQEIELARKNMEVAPEPKKEKEEEKPPVNNSAPAPQRRQSYKTRTMTPKKDD